MGSTKMGVTSGLTLQVQKYQHHTVKILYHKQFCNEHINLMYLI